MRKRRFKTTVVTNENLPGKPFGGLLQLQRIGIGAGNRLLHHHIFARLSRLDRMFHMIRRTGGYRHQLHIRILQKIRTVVVDMERRNLLHRSFTTLHVNIAPGNHFVQVRIQPKFIEMHSVPGPTESPDSHANPIRHFYLLSLSATW